MSKPTLYLHVGAHKTATTHLQDTLQAMQERLVEGDINYLYRPFFRNGKLERLKRMTNSRFKVFDALTFGHFSSLYINVIFGNYFPSYKNIIISEENILGYAWQLLSVRPFIDSMEGSLSFVHYLNKHFRVKFLFSIRDFKGIYPGAYTTALRFNPNDAMIAKQNLRKELEAGLLPSWVDVISNIKKLFPENDIAIWTQEDYRTNSLEIISSLFNVDVKDVPDITPPSETVTPNSVAVEEVEKLVANGSMKNHNWTTACDDIYAKNAAEPLAERYSFLTKDIQIKLSNKYSEDKQYIYSKWKNDFLYFNKI